MESSKKVISNVLVPPPPQLDVLTQFVRTKQLAVACYPLSMTLGSIPNNVPSL
jgi:hypothetical protein